jgi:hypothetical protein
MFDDMAMPARRSDTQRDHIRFVRGLVAFLVRQPDAFTLETIRRLLVHQRDSDVQLPYR